MNRCRGSARRGANLTSPYLSLVKVLSDAAIETEKQSDSTENNKEQEKHNHKKNDNIKICKHSP